MEITQTLYTIDPNTELSFSEKMALVAREREYDSIEQSYSNLQELEEYIKTAKKYGLKL